MKKNKIVIVGGGYAGLRAVEHLARDAQNEIILIDRHTYHYMQTEVYDFVANEKDFSKITVDLETYCQGFDGNVTFYKEQVDDINFANKEVISNVQKHSYDYLMIAVGARTRFINSIEGLREHSYGIKALSRAMYFKQKFEKSIFKQIEEHGENKSSDELNIVVAGAGLSGVEVAAQMASYSREFFARNNFMCQRLNIVLIDAYPTILMGIDEGLVKKSIKRLEELDVIIKDDRMVTKVTPNSVTLNSGEVLPVDFMIFAGGIEPSQLVHDLDIPKNERGYIEVNEHFQTEIAPEVFAVGDCINLFNNGEFIAPTADVAEQMAEVCAANIKAMIKGQKLQKHNVKSRGILIALGRRYAVGKLFGVYISGYFAYFVKKMVEVTYARNLRRLSAKGFKKILSKR